MRRRRGFRQRRGLLSSPLAAARLASAAAIRDIVANSKASRPDRRLELRYSAPGFRGHRPRTVRLPGLPLLRRLRSPRSGLRRRAPVGSRRTSDRPRHHRARRLRDVRGTYRGDAPAMLRATCKRGSRLRYRDLREPQLRQRALPRECGRRHPQRRRYPGRGAAVSDRRIPRPRAGVRSERAAKSVAGGRRCRDRSRSGFGARRRQPG